MASTSTRKRRRSTLPVDDLLRNIQYHEQRFAPCIPAPSNLPAYIDSGDCDFVCTYCGALFWQAEKASYHSRKDKPVYTRCCKLGRIVLPPPQYPLPAIVAFYKDRSFRENIRAYNSLFAMTSFGAKVDNTVNDGFGPYTFKISGQISHWVGNLCPGPNSSPRFLQLYIYDSANEVSNRLNVYNNSDTCTLRSEVVGILTQLLGTINKYVRMFKNSIELAEEQELDEYAIRLYNTIPDPRYGLPEAGTVSGIVSGDDPNATSFDVLVYSKSGHPHRISKLHPAYMPLQYPLILPYGDPGWSPSLKQFSVSELSPKSLTINMYYCYLCHDRRLIYSLIVNSGRLFQQFLVDSYVCIEECRLDYIRSHQNELWSEYVSGVYDAIRRGDSDGRSIGKKVFLPSSFVGGPRYMYSHYQDALAISRVYGNPQYFITFTCNVGWNEIRRFMSSHSICQSQDRPDIIARIFRIKVVEFIAFFKLDKSFGDVSAYLYTIEFQKRGLPHCHTLLWVCPSSRIKTPDDVDRFISAELPDPLTEHDLYNTITTCMLHGPCGFLNLRAPCIRDGKCKKGFPKPFTTKTYFDKDGYVHYRRRDISSFTTASGVQVHNGFVVPYNKRLSSRFNAHINVEYCGWNMMIKYLFKYISKGVDRVTYSFQSNNVASHSNSSSAPSQNSSVSSSDKDLVDEVQNFLEGCFICPHEAAWRILNFPIHERHPAVQVLAVHQEDMQNSTFRDNYALQALIRSPTFGRTTLTRWLASNCSDTSGRHLTYVEYPSLFRWDLSKKDWIHRSRNSTPSVGRLAYVHPTAGELFYLRMLLCHQVGCQSFEDIRTVNGNMCASFRLACDALGLTGDDKEWLTAFANATTWASSSQLRTLFCHLLLFCDVSNPHQLWDETWTKMGDDIIYSFSSASTSMNTSISEEALKNYILSELETILNDCTPPKSLEDYQLPLPTTTSTTLFTNRLLVEETSYDRDSLRQQHSNMVLKLNECQRVVYDRVRKDFSHSKQSLIFVYGHGGTGKTFLWSTILAYFRSNGHIILVVAASGIAALLLPAGRTAHSRFNIPIDLTNTAVCNIKRKSQLCSLLKQTSIIIWDEATMTDRSCFECVDRTFRGVLENEHVPFGGISMLLGGDFRQTLPVKRKKKLQK